MSFGIPVIVTDRCGASELIENGKSGWIIESRNFDQLAERISFAQNNREVATKIGLGGRQKAIENSIEVHDRKLVHMIESAMKNECE
jgi:glycosyltransferase involved in cell wall biosynthesis